MPKGSGAPYDLQFHRSLQIHERVPPSRYVVISLVIKHSFLCQAQEQFETRQVSILEVH